LKWKTLEHNGILFPPEYEYKKLVIKIKKKKIQLNELQEEMAWAWVAKRNTPYINDKVFIKNFLNDFKKLFPKETFSGIEMCDIDFSEIIKFQEKQKEYNSKPEIKKQLSIKRKRNREILKEKYGYAKVDGIKTEMGNYMVEPPGIFMGRGEHPFRGKWKKRTYPEEVTLNLGKQFTIPKTPIPNRKWKKIINDQESTWMACWNDELTHKTKYVWLGDSSSIKQQQDRTKYDKALILNKSIGIIRNHIAKGMESKNIKEKKIATVAYLIDELAMRVGDEKDKDEADTVGATTLRVEHVEIKNNNIKFDFLGKDSVKWQKSLSGEENKQLVNNLKEFMDEKGKNELIFDNINSESVNKFFGKSMKKITAKVFRTYHASNEVVDYLQEHKIHGSDSPDVKIFTAKMANLKAAIQCNHKRTPPKNLQENINKKKEKHKEINKKLKDIKIQMNNKEYKCQICDEIVMLENHKLNCENSKYHKKEPSMKKKIERQEKNILKEKEKLQKTYTKLEERSEKLKLKIKLDSETKDYSLNTSLRNYIDPRIYKKWSDDAEMDWKKLYPATLQKKFLWVDSEEKQTKSI